MSSSFLEDKGIGSDELLTALHSILEDADLTQTTGKHVRLQIEQRFGLQTDALIDHKKKLNELLNTILPEVSAKQAAKQNESVKSGKAAKAGKRTTQSAKKKSSGDDSDNVVSDESEYGESEKSEHSEQSEQSDVSEDSEDYKPKRKAAGRAGKPAAKRAPKRKKRRSDSESEDEDSDDSYGGRKRKRTTATRTTRAKAQPKRRVNTHLAKLKQLAAIHHVSLIKPKNVPRMDEDAAIDYLESVFDDREIDYSDLTVNGLAAAQLKDELAALDGSGSEAEENASDASSEPAPRGRRALRARKPVKYEDDGEDLSDTQLDAELQDIYGDDLFVKTLTAEEKAAKAVEAEIKKAAAQAAREARLKIKLEKEAEAAKNRPPPEEEEESNENGDEAGDEQEGDEDVDDDQEDGDASAGEETEGGQDEEDEEEEAPKQAAGRRRKRIDDDESDNYHPEESGDD